VHVNAVCPPVIHTEDFRQRFVQHLVDQQLAVLRVQPLIDLGLAVSLELPIACDVSTSCS